MKKNFCDALAANDREIIRNAVDNFLRDLPAKNNQQENFEEIKTWVESHDCIASVEISPGVLDSYPPIKVFIVNLKNSEHPTSIGIMLHEKQWKYNLK